MVEDLLSKPNAKAKLTEQCTSCNQPTLKDTSAHVSPVKCYLNKAVSTRNLWFPLAVNQHSALQIVNVFSCKKPRKNRCSGWGHLDAAAKLEFCSSTLAHEHIPFNSPPTLFFVVQCYNFYFLYLFELAGFILSVLNLNIITGAYVNGLHFSQQFKASFLSHLTWHWLFPFFQGFSPLIREACSVVTKLT